MRSVLLVLVASFALTACGGLRASKLPSQGGPRWRELRSPHFVLWTDLAPEDARQTIRTLEDYRTLLVGVVFGDAPRARNGRSLVVGVRSYDDWRLLGARPELVGITWPAENIVRQPVLAFVGEDERGFDTDRGSILVHELAHLVTFSVLGPHPRWLSEGIATYFESARIDRKARTGRFGRFPPRFQRVLDRQGLQPFDRVVFGDLPLWEIETRGYYNASHIVVSFLMNSRPDALMEYQRRLTEVAPQQQDAVWAQIFPDLGRRALDEAVIAWLARGAVREHQLRLTLEEPRVSERELGDADVLATRALVSAAIGGASVASRKLVVQHTNAALALEPTHPLASLLAAMAVRRADAARARAVSEAHPDDYMAWLLRVAATTGESQKESFARLCALAGDNPAIDLSPLGRCDAR